MNRWLEGRIAGSVDGWRWSLVMCLGDIYGKLSIGRVAITA